MAMTSSSKGLRRAARTPTAVGSWAWTPGSHRRGSWSSRSMKWRSTLRPPRYPGSWSPRRGASARSRTPRCPRGRAPRTSPASACAMPPSFVACVARMRAAARSAGGDAGRLVRGVPERRVRRDHEPVLAPVLVRCRPAGCRGRAARRRPSRSSRDRRGRASSDRARSDRRPSSRRSPLRGWSEAIDEAAHQLRR